MNQITLLDGAQGTLLWQKAEAQGIPFTNYGLVIAHITGVLERSLRLFPEIHALLGEETQ